MSNANKPVPVKVRYSIVRRLSSRLFFRLFGIFLSLDITICMIAGVSLAVYCERAAASAAALLVASETYGQDGTAAYLQGAEVEIITEKPSGFRVVEPFSLFLPEITRSSLRSAELGYTAGDTLLRRLSGLRYNVFFESGADTFKISVGLGVFLVFFRWFLTALLIYEFLILLSRLPKDRRIVRATLDPISELAETAKTLNQAEGRLDPEKMAALAGKLEGINAAKLDTRIPVEGTQDELRSLAVAINGMLDRINESYRAQVRFVSDASHELRTPISVIQGYANLLDRWGKKDEKALQESITAIKEEAANMKELVEQLLFLARGDNNTIKLEPEAFDFGELAGEVVRETEMIDTGHRFEVRGEGLTVTADRPLIKQALRILVDNAIKYTDPGGHIVVSAGQEDGFAALSVTDDGIGISPEMVPQIFDRFYRADESRARATGGAGLGLSIAKWIAARHGGHMAVVSRLGIGTRVTLAIPLNSGLFPQSPPPQPEPEKPE